ncbi:MAG: lipopolysaccharide biosynthesis protein [Sphingomonadaceae bacterium]|nr:lipopolysaccharide biosynthesis protein [Sphingomonadaceae bacterium]
MWRSGSQVVAQLSMWASTFWVLRLLSPSDYGLYAMTSGVMVLLSMLNGQGFAGALIRAETITAAQIRQMFGLLLLLNGAIALVQFAVAPLVAAYFRYPLVGTMLRVQTLLYFANPFIVLPGALLARAMDFSRQAKVNLLAAAVGALTSLIGALSGLGVWTLVCAPLALVWTRAIGMTIAARMLVRPSFGLAGASATVLFGGAMLLSDLLWLVQTQSDIAIGGRALDPHRLGVYTTALFLAQIVTSKFIPPLNEVAFTAYASLQHQTANAGRAFERSVRIIMLVALPFYFALAVTAKPFVETMLGPKWHDVIPVVAIIALAMPFLTLQILFAPATTALGHTRVQVYSAAAGAVIMPLSFLIGIEWGVIGMAWSWLIAMPLLTSFTASIAMPVLGTSTRALLRAVRPALLAATGMAVVVVLTDRVSTVEEPAIRLALLAGVGGVSYGVLALLAAKSVVLETVSLFRQSRPTATFAG